MARLLEWRVLVGLVLVLVAMGISFVATRSGAPSRPVHLVLVSGRDDHGLVRDHEVLLYAAPEGRAIVGRIHDGRVARVLDVEGDWLRVRAVGEPQGEGWLNDFYLRDRASRVDGGGQVTLLEALEEAGRVRVAARPVGQPRAATEWVDAAALREVGARASAADAHH